MTDGQPLGELPSRRRRPGRRVRLYRRYSVRELTAMDQAICANPAHRTPPGSFFLYTPEARKHRSDIAWAITYHLNDMRRAATRDPEGA